MKATSLCCCFFLTINLIVSVESVWEYELVQVQRRATTNSYTDSTAASTTNEPLVHSVQVNPHDFEYVINPGKDICGDNFGSDVFLFIYVHSAPEHIHRRIAIRETWARRSMFKNIRLAFMTGLSKETKQNDLLKLESDVYNDIVQEDFIDSYKNLTYKGIMALKWITEYCSNAQYILKADDDMIVNTFSLIRHLKALSDHSISKENTLFCLVWIGMGVIRDKNSKWYISQDEYQKDVYDPYCSGAAFLLTTDLVPRMYRISFYVKFFWVDDYYVSGRLAKAANATHHNFNSLYIINSDAVESKFYGSNNEHAIFGHIPNKLDTLYSIWSYLTQVQLARFPSLCKMNGASLIKENDFKLLVDIKWSQEMWRKFSDFSNSIELNEFSKINLNVGEDF